ncbi:autoinducer synthesis protein [Beijerinckia indica subsp. indica ATCC 9039]|uniref:Acyl-homoserine-lactone synthase n=2 Tax=Beijerinckia TaxID=532 RepID=B2IL00_BEII9|nr:autoinducer synthesis protein [Beijerinckia indica subsp. indica ATCC 9039]
MVWIVKCLSISQCLGPLPHEMFEDRKRVFVDLLRWNVPVSEGRYEIDQFDDEYAIYLIVEDGNGRHLGSARLLQTSRPHILGSLYPHLCDTEVPHGDSTVEITRFCLSPRITAQERKRVRQSLVSAFVVYAIMTGIKTYTGVANNQWFKQIVNFGWDCEPLSCQNSTAYTDLIAFKIAITEQTIHLLQQSGMFTEDTLQMLQSGPQAEQKHVSNVAQECEHAI